MPNVIFVVGLPGSGKSHYAKALAKQTESELFDDYKSNAIGNCSRFPFGRNYIELVNSPYAVHMYALTTCPRRTAPMG